jgi:solute carrier family 26 (sodium-independent sulfate anion transporter), member 11
VPNRGDHRDDTLDDKPERSDPERGPDAKRPYKTAVYGEDGAALVPLDTPFFHFDLVGAVRAAEGGLARQFSRPSSASGEDDYAKTN